MGCCATTQIEEIVDEPEIIQKPVLKESRPVDNSNRVRQILDNKLKSTKFKYKYDLNILSNKIFERLSRIQLSDGTFGSNNANEYVLAINPNGIVCHCLKEQNGSQEAFGELEPSMITPGQVYIKSNGESEVWYLKKTDYDTIIYDMNELIISSFLRNDPSTKKLIESLSSQDHKLEFIGNIHRESFNSGDVILSYAQASKFYLIMEGEIQIYVNENQKDISLYTLKTSDFFGHESILYNIRLIKYEAKTSVQLISIDSDLVQKIYKNNKIILDDIYDRLLEIGSIFTVVSQNQKLILKSGFNISTYQKDTEIIKNDTQNSLFYLILNGTVSTTFVYSNKVYKSHTIRENDYFGEVSLLNNCNATASITCMTDVVVLTINRSQFLEVFSMYRQYFSRKRIEHQMGAYFFFQGFNIDEDVLVEIIDQSEMVFYNEETILFNIGDKPELFFISEGGPIDKKDINDVTMAISFSKVFGHESILLNSIYNYSVIVNSGAKISIFKLDIFDKYIKNKLFNLNSLIIGKPIGCGNFSVVKKVEIRSLRDLNLCLKIVDKKKVKINDKKFDDLYNNEVDDKDIKKGDNLININDVNKNKILPSMEKKMLKSMKLWNKLSNPFLQYLICTFKDENSYYFLSGEELYGDLRNILSFKFSPIFRKEIVIFIMASLLLGLKSMNEIKYIHRNIRPENILVSNDGYVKLGGFSFIKYLNRNNRSFTIIGCEDYIPPEVWVGKGQTHKGDYWSLGIVMYELLTGSVPFPCVRRGLKSQIGRVLEGIVEYSRLPREIAPMLTKLINVHPSSRFRNIDEIFELELFKDINIKDLEKHKLKSPIRVTSDYQRKKNQSFEYKLLGFDEIIIPPKDIQFRRQESKLNKNNQKISKTIGQLDNRNSNNSMNNNNSPINNNNNNNKSLSNNNLSNVNGNIPISPDINNNVNDNNINNNYDGIYEEDEVYYDNENYDEDGNYDDNINDDRNYVANN